MRSPVYPDVAAVADGHEENSGGEIPMPTDFYRHLLDNLADGVYFVDRSRQITYWNRGAESISGYSASEVLGRSCADNLLVHTNEKGCQLCRKGCPLQAVMNHGGHRAAEVYLKHKEGHRVAVVVKATPILDRSGKVIGAVELFCENRAAASAERASALEKLALLDSLTGLANRRCAESVLERRWQRFKQDARPFFLMIIDIDRFKAVNDTHGHLAGDAVLRVVAKTLTASIRESDFVGRWGGEEFLFLAEAPDVREAMKVAERCRNLVRKCAVPWKEATLRPTISICVTIAQPEDRPDEAMARADTNLYAAKRHGRNCCMSD